MGTLRSGRVASSVNHTRTMALQINTLRPPVTVFAAILCTLFAMIVAFLTTRALFPDNWRPTEAEIISTHIVSSREGGLTWKILAEIQYKRDGASNRLSNFKILHESEREDAVARQEQWPNGKVFTIYVNPKNELGVSLVPDGGRESLAVAVAVLTPAASICIIFAAILLRRRQLTTIPTHGSN